MIVVGLGASIDLARAYVARQGTVTPVTRPDILANDWERLGKTAADAARSRSEPASAAEQPTRGTATG